MTNFFAGVIADTHFRTPSGSQGFQEFNQVAARLPFLWTPKTIAWAGKQYPAATHVPVMIYPSPLAADRYVVLNTGHTFHAADLEGTNALLYPRLGDHALLELTAVKKDPLSVEVHSAGLFHDFWRWPK